MKILEEFSSPVIDFSGLDEYRRYGWQRQLHLLKFLSIISNMESPQLGSNRTLAAVQTKSEAAIGNYTRALSLGGMRTLPELFRAAGLKFDFPFLHPGTDAFVKKEMEA